VGVAIVVTGGAEISGTQLRKYEDLVKEAGGGGLTFFKVQDADRVKQQVIFPGDLLDEFLARVNAKQGERCCSTNGPWEQTCRPSACCDRSSGSRSRGRAFLRARSRRHDEQLAVPLGAPVPALRARWPSARAGAATSHVHDAQTRSISISSRAIPGE